MTKSSEKLKTVTRVGVDLAKNVLQIHAIGNYGNYGDMISIITGT